MQHDDPNLLKFCKTDDFSGTSSVAVGWWLENLLELARRYDCEGRWRGCSRSKEPRAVLCRSATRERAFAEEEEVPQWVQGTLIFELGVETCIRLLQWQVSKVARNQLWLNPSLIRNLGEWRWRPEEESKVRTGIGKAMQNLKSVSRGGDLTSL